MSELARFFLLAAIEVGGLFVIWFLVRARVRRYLELENLLGGVREEARALILELNQTADRNVSLVEDRMSALRELLGEVDRRIGVERRELETRVNEREVYARLSRRRPIVPGAEAPAPPPEAASRRAEPSAQPAEPPAPPAEPITLSLGPAAAASRREQPAVKVNEDSLIPPKTLREEALELYRRGFSADLIAARTGATVAEIELLVELEERRQAGAGSSL
jgi:hypothetical protein